MASINEIYAMLLNKLSEALKVQRELYVSAFDKGLHNTLEIIAQAANNKERIECWQELIKDLRAEMLESGIFSNEQNGYPRKTSISNKITGLSATVSEKPTSITVLGQQTEIQYWKDIPHITCQILHDKHTFMFEGIENEPSLQGRERPYITKNSTLLRSPRKIIGSHYFVETNLSRGDCIKLAVLLLEHFGYKSSDLQINGSTHNTVNQKELQYVSKAPVYIDDEIKIGVRARTIFTQLFSEEKLSDEELLRLCRLDYSKQKLGLNLPALKLIPPGKHASSARKDQNGHNRYYKDVYVAGNNRYLLCSQWFKRQYPQLEKYFESLN